MRSPFATYSLAQLVRGAITPFAAIWVVQIYGTAGNHPVLAWLYVPFIALCAFRLTALAIVFALALIAREVAAPGLPVVEAGLGLQTAFVLYWSWRGKLLRRPREGTSFARIYARLLRAMRPCFIAVAMLLTGGLLFRGKPAVECLLWSICAVTAASAVPMTGKIRWRAALATAMVTLVSIAIGVNVLEFGARALLPPAPGPSDMYMPVPVYIFTLRPNSKSEFYVRGAVSNVMTVEAEISAQGVRDRDFGPKGADEYRIVMIGDSYTMGHGLAPEQNISRVLERLLHQSDFPKRISVINCGVGGYAPWQERGSLNARGFAFEPDLVMLQVFPANDVAGTLTRVGKFLEVPDIGWENRIAEFRLMTEFPVNVQRWCEVHLRTYAAVAQALNRPNLVVDIVRDFRFFSVAAYPQPKIKAERNPYREASLIEWYPELEEGYRLMEEDIRGIRDDCRARGVDLIAYCHPFPMGVIVDGFEEFDRETEGTLFERNKDVRVTQEIFARAEVPYVDVTSALEAEPDPAALYFEYDGHFTPRGAAVVARALAGYLMRSYLPERMHAP